MLWSRRGCDGSIMSWDNYGKWHIDHIKPLADFDLSDPKQFKEACHYSNLQPLWAEENHKKIGFRRCIIKAVNLPSGAQRDVEVGLVWEEVLTGAAGTFEVPVQGTIRVDCITDSTITIGGTLAMSIRAGRVERINVGVGTPEDSKVSVTVVIAVGTCNVQVAKEKDARDRRAR